MVLARLPSSPYRAPTLASSLRCDGLERTYAEGERVFAQFRDPDAAQHLATSAKRVFALGPYAVTDSTSEMIRFTAKGERSIDAIELVGVPFGDAWRRLLARDLDVIPILSELHRPRFDRVDTVHLVASPTIVGMALVFNVREAPFDSRPLRRHIANHLDRAAIGRIACGTADCAWQLWLESIPGESPVTDRSTTMPLTVLQSHHSAVIAARVVRHQLSRYLTVAVDAVPIAEYRRRLLKGDFSAILMPAPIGGQAAAKKIAWLSGATGFSEALANGDSIDIDAVMTDMMPAVPLYEVRQFAAIDDRFCGGRPTNPRSWAWLANMKLCEEDER